MMSILMLGSIILAVPLPLNASTDAVRWSPVNLPSEGQSGGWVLAKGSDILHLTRAGDGVLYCYANPAGTNQRLFKSADNGISWSYTGKVEAEIVDIAIARDEPGRVYYATASVVYRSLDSGKNFSAIAVNPGGAGSNNVKITSIDVASVGGGCIIAIGTADTGAGQYGGVFILDESESSDVVNTAVGNYDVYAVVFSPDFVNERQLVAVVTDESDTIIMDKVSDGGWSQATGKAVISGITPASADVAFPDDYSPVVASGHYTQFVGISTGSGNGDVFKIEGKTAPAFSVATDLDIGSVYGLNSADVTSLAIMGEAADAVLIAGAGGSAQVYSSSDGGRNWRRSTKPPTGGTKTFVLLPPDFAESHVVYAATGGTESAFSISQDSGMTWNQVSLIDTKIDTILDLAVSPGYVQDGTLFLITFGGKHSLWHTTDGGGHWARLYSSALPHVDGIDMVELSPQYGKSKVVFLSGVSDGRPVVWKSAGNGQFLGLATRDPVTGNAFNVDNWAIASDNTLFIGSFNGSNGLVYRSTNGGMFYANRAVVGGQSLNSIALSPDYENDKTILAGNKNGWVFRSDDNGLLFETLPSGAATAPLAGLITVAFDPEYHSNKTVYAASATQNKGIYRFVIGKSSKWESIDSTLPDGGKLNQVTSGDGVLYASNNQGVSAADNKGGIERCLNPTYALGPKFETVTDGLVDGAALTGLWINGNRLWSVDTINVRLMTYIDTLKFPVILTSPSDNAAAIGTSDVRVNWEALEGATGYEWQLDYDTDFSKVPAGFEDDTSASSARLPKLELDTTYCWRVRAKAPVLSQWSTTWSFTTTLGTETATVKLVNPEAGETGVSLKPSFQWSAIDGADSYELLVSAEDSFVKPVIIKTGDYALPSTAWSGDLNLDFDTVYYWKARALSSNTHSPWSPVGSFTTETKPVTGPLDGLFLPPVPLAPGSPATPPKTTSPPQQPVPYYVVPPLPAQTPPPLPIQETIPAWIQPMFYMGGALLLCMMAILIALIVLVVKAFRS